jgi:hypothetical protein
MPNVPVTEPGSVFPYPIALMDYALRATQLAFDSQEVIALRLTKLAQGGPAAAIEAWDMVNEKMCTLIEAQCMALAAAGRGDINGADQILKLYGQRVGDNLIRLGSH